MKKLSIPIFFFLICSEFGSAVPARVTVLKEVVVRAKTFEQEIFDTCLELGSDTLTARIFVAQARYESGNFSNSLTINHNNFFSMQHPRKRPTTSLGPLASAEGRKNRYASYRSVRDAVIDLFFYLQARNIDFRQPSVDRYVRILKSKHFFEQRRDRYQRAVQKHFNEYNV